MRRGSTHRASRATAAATVALVALVTCVVVTALRPWARRTLGIGLIRALRKDEAGKAAWLLRLGADVNTVDPVSGSTPLSAAVGGGSDVLPLLLRRRDLRFDSSPTGGMSPLLIALRLNEPPTVLQLLEAEARLGQAPTSPAARLARAAIRGDAAALQAQLAAGTPPDTREPDWPTPLSLAALFGHPEVAALLLRHGADPNGTDAGWVESSGFEPRPLMLAARADFPELIRQLLDAGAGFAAAADRAHGPLYTAVGARAASSVEAMLRHARAAEISRSDLKSAFALAKEQGETATAARLRREWEKRTQTAGPHSIGPAVDGRLDRTLRFEAIPLPGRPARGVMVARGNTLYLVEPSQVRALTLEPSRITPRWQVSFAGRIGSGETPIRCAATEQGLVIAAATARTGDGKLTHPEIQGLRVEDGRPWFRYPEAAVTETLGLVEGAEDTLLTQRVSPGTAGGAPTGTVEWLLFDPRSGRPRRTATAEEQVEAVVPLGNPEGDFATLNAYGHVATVRGSTLRGTPWEPWVHRDLKAGEGRLYALRHEPGGVYAGCFEPSGKPVWRWKCPAGRPAALRAATPRIVLVESADRLWALDPVTGRPRWSAPAATRPAGFRGDAYLRDPFVDDFAARLVMGEQVVAATSAPGSRRVDRLTALDVNTGKTLWTQQVPYSLERMIHHRGVLYGRARGLDGKGLLKDNSYRWAPPRAQDVVPFPVEFGPAEGQLPLLGVRHFFARRIRPLVQGRTNL